MWAKNNEHVSGATFSFSSPLRKNDTNYDRKSNLTTNNEAKKYC